MMRQHSVVLGFIVVILIAASMAILAGSFQVKERGKAATLASSIPNATKVATNNNQENTPALQLTNPPHIDGKIGPDEYKNHYPDPRILMELYWTIDQQSQTIYFALQSLESGCIGISLGAVGRRIKGGDVLSGFIDDNGTLQFTDDYAKDDTMHTPDIKLGIELPNGGTSQTQQYGTDDILEKKGMTSPQGTIVEFSRKLNTGDTAFDKPIEPAPMRVQLAFSSKADDECMDGDSTNMVTKQINFFTGVVGDEPQS
jgi:hypothetical protein